MAGSLLDLATGLPPGAAALIASLCGCAPAPPPATGFGGPLYVNLSRPGARVDAAAAAALLNDYRRLSGLPPVSVDPDLMRFAEAQADRVVGAQSLAIPGGKSVDARLHEAGIRGSGARENISAGYYTLSDAFSGWRGSKPNDETLRLASARRMGIAVRHAPGSRYALYWALVMAP